MIKFVYFDVGGVAITDLVANKKWGEMKRELGVTLEMDSEFEKFYDKYEAEICLGRETDSLIPMMKKRFGLKFPPGYSLLKDFVDRFERNESLWPIIRKARKKYGIGLLTNMYPGMLDLIRKRGLIPEVVWDVVVDSSIEKLQKPDVKIFKLAEKRARVPAREILFVENSKEYVEAAKKCGWQTFFYNSSNRAVSSHTLSKLL